MSPAEFEEAERLARQTNRSLSGLLREGLKRLKADRYWEQIHAFSRPKAYALDVAEGDVVRLVHEYRREKRQKAGKKPAK
jgi:predicted nucleic acid-binding Zn ribbon protein